MRCGFFDCYAPYVRCIRSLQVTGRIFVCLNFRHVHKVKYKLTAFIFVLRSREISE